MRARKARPRDFFSALEAQSIVDAIERAERNTSGEIRVHVEQGCKGKDAYERGRQVFERLGMTSTALRNGVLIYLATGDRVFAVLGDAGIDQRVPEGFWNDVVLRMEARFQEDAFAPGLVEAIESIGQKLSAFFPYEGDAKDVNELPNELSLGDPDADPSEQAENSRD